MGGAINYRQRMNERGFMMPLLLSFIVVAGILTLAAVGVIFTNLTNASYDFQREEALNIAEAGINYYVWHLSHNPKDFQDGQGTPATQNATLGYGPYTHNYIDSNDVKEGTYTLWIKPQGGGSTLVTVRSTGAVAGTDISRTVQAVLGETSFSDYAVVSDSALWFGNNETADGPVHSNQGVRMDGKNTGPVTSTNATYVPSYSVGGDGASHPGVWCSTSVTSPVNCATRSKSDWYYPTSQIDFNQISGSLCSIKKTAFASYSSTSSLATQSNACSLTPSTRTAAYIPERSRWFSSSRGYMIQLNPNDTYDLYDVNGVDDLLSPYSNALSLQQVATGIPIPSSGVIFVEDNVWVRSNPTFQGRVSIASGRLSSNWQTTNITIADNLVYSSKNGSDTIGLISQGSVLIAPYAPPASGSFNFEVDAAILAETGNVMYPDTYQSAPFLCTRGWTNSDQTFTFYGSVGMRQTWTWTWLDGNYQCGYAAYDSTNGYVSGIEHNTTTFDYNLQHSPPPQFPVTGGYTILSWREVLNSP